MIPGVLASEHHQLRLWGLKAGRNLFRAFVDRQCRTRTHVLQNMLSSGSNVKSRARSCSHASTSTHVGHASSSDERVVHELSWCGLPQFEG